MSRNPRDTATVTGTCTVHTSWSTPALHGESDIKWTLSLEARALEARRIVVSSPSGSSWYGIWALSVHMWQFSPTPFSGGLIGVF